MAATTTTKTDPGSSPFPPRVPLPHYDDSETSAWPRIDSSLRSLLAPSDPLDLDVVCETLKDVLFIADEDGRAQIDYDPRRVLFPGLRSLATQFGTEAFLTDLLPFIVTQALRLPELLPVSGHCLSFLTSSFSGGGEKADEGGKKKAVVSLSKQTCCSLLALSFLGAVDCMYDLAEKQEDHDSSFCWVDDMPKFSASLLWRGHFVDDTQVAKGRMLLDYFERRRTKHHCCCSFGVGEEEEEAGEGKEEEEVQVEFERVSLFPPLVFPDSGKSGGDSKSASVSMSFSPQTVRMMACSFIPQEALFVPCTLFPKGSLRLAPPPSRHADFANAFLGGGVFCGGCVQEEILFAENPECCVGMLMCPKMGPNEAILIRGTEQFASHTGYGFSLQFDDSEEARARVEEENVIREVEIVAMDAVDYRCRGPRQQFYPKDMMRDVWKAYVAFSGANKPISTGNWGCGAFLGNKNLKFVEQYIAASAAGCELLYYSFERPGEEFLSESYREFVDYVRSEKCGVRDVYDALLRVTEILQEKGIELSRSTGVLVTKVLIKVLRGEDFTADDV